VAYQLRLAPEHPHAVADPDLIKRADQSLGERGEAARSGRRGLASTAVEGERLAVEVHDFRSGVERPGPVDSL